MTSRESEQYWKNENQESKRKMVRVHMVTTNESSIEEGQIPESDFIGEQIQWLLGGCSNRNGLTTTTLIDRIDTCKSIVS